VDDLLKVVHHLDDLAGGYRASVPSAEKLGTSSDLLRRLGAVAMPPWYSPMRTELVTTLKRQATELLSDLARDREPILITQRGVPSAYLVDIETYEAMQRRIHLLEGIARGEKAVEEGRTLSHASAKKRMARWLR